MFRYHEKLSKLLVLTRGSFCFSANDTLLKNETLIEDQKGVTAELLKHCDLVWEDRCLEFYKTERDVRTISIRQVRNPINRKSLGLWKNYEKSLSKMQQSLVEFS